MRKFPLPLEVFPSCFFLIAVFSKSGPYCTNVKNLTDPKLLNGTVYLNRLPLNGPLLVACSLTTF